MAIGNSLPVGSTTGLYGYQGTTTPINGGNAQFYNVTVQNNANIGNTLTSNTIVATANTYTGNIFTDGYFYANGAPFLGGGGGGQPAFGYHYQIPNNVAIPGTALNPATAVDVGGAFVAPNDGWYVLAINLRVDTGIPGENVTGALFQDGNIISSTSMNLGQDDGVSLTSGTYRAGVGSTTVQLTAGSTYSVRVWTNDPNTDYILSDLQNGWSSFSVGFLGPQNAYGDANVSAYLNGQIASNIVPFFANVQALGNTSRPWGTVFTENLTIGQNSFTSNGANAQLNGQTIVTQAPNGDIFTAGNVYGNFLYGDGYYISNIGGATNYSNANVAAFMVTTTSNIGTIGFAPNAIFANSYYYGNGTPFTGGGGNANYSNANVASYLLTSTGNIGSVGNAPSGIYASQYWWANGQPFVSSNYGDANVELLLSSGNLTTPIGTSANIAGNYLFGNGAYLTGLPAQYGNTNVTSLLSSGNFTANIVLTTGKYFVGDGRYLTNIDAGNIIGGYGNGNVAAYLPNYTGNIGAFGMTKVSIGNASGGFDQGQFGVAIGEQSGQNNQGVSAIAIGLNAGQNNQGTGAIAIGALSGINNQANNSIIINASGAGVDATNINSTYIAPIRTDLANTSVGLFYNPSTKEVTTATPYGDANVEQLLPDYSGNIGANNIVALGNISAQNITGNISGATGGYGDSNVAVFLPTYTGNLESLTGDIITTANVYSNNILTLGNVWTDNISGANNVIAYHFIGNTVQLSGDANIAGNLNVIGNVNYSNVSQLVVGDPLVQIAANNTTNLLDVGFFAQYNTGNANIYTGMARNHTTGQWNIFDNLSTQPSANSTIDWGNSVPGNLVAGSLSFAWSNSASYSTGSMVTSGNTVYRANGNITPGLGFTIGTTGNTWRPLNQHVAPPTTYFVDAQVGNDGYEGSQEYPFKTFAKLLTMPNLNSGCIVYLKPGIYTENVNWTATNVNIIGSGFGSLCSLTGTWTFSHPPSSVRVSGVTFTQPVTLSATGNFYAIQCQFADINKTGTGYVQFDVCDCNNGATSITGAGYVNINDSKILSLTINNANAVVTMDSSIASPTTGIVATLGTLAMVSSQAIGTTANANVITGSVGSYVLLDSCIISSSTGAAGRVSLQGLWSTSTTNFDRANSSLTGTNTNSVDISDSISLINNLSAATANISGNVSLVGNVKVGNIFTNGYYYANGAPFAGGGGGNGTAIANGTSNVSIATANGNITMAVGGSNVGIISGTSIALGLNSANATQGANSVAIGTQAGANTQGAESVAIGYGAGNNSQGARSVAIGNAAGSNSQQAQSVAVGQNSGANTQGPQAVAVGYNSAQFSQGALATAVGALAGNNLQGSQAVAVGYTAGINTQGSQSVAVGYNAGAATQGNGAVALGSQAGANAQGIYSIAIGAKAGQNIQANNSIIISASGNALDAGNSALYIDPLRNITTGYAVFYDPTTKEVSYAAGGGGGGGSSISNGNTSVIIPTGNGSINFNVNNTPFGSFRPPVNSIALGSYSGNSSSFNPDTIAIGSFAGANGQGTIATAIGSYAGSNVQGDAAIAIGYNSGATAQGYAAIAIGREAGLTNQADFSIAIGAAAGYSNQKANTIVLNATGNNLNTPVANATYVSSIRNDTGNLGLALYYNDTTREITSGPVGGNVISNGTSKVYIPDSGGAINFTIGNIANIVNFSQDNASGSARATANITGRIAVTGNSGNGFSSAWFGPGYDGNLTPWFQGTTMAVRSNGNTYSQIVAQNKSNGAASTTDFVATADIGGDSTYYIDMGIASSAYSNVTPTNSLGNSLAPLDGYLYTQNTNLVIGTNASGKVLKIIAGGSTSANVVTTFANNNVTFGNAAAWGNISANNITFGSANAYPANTIVLSATGTTKLLSGGADKFYVDPVRILPDVEAGNPKPGGNIMFYNTTTGEVATGSVPSFAVSSNAVTNISSTNTFFSVNWNIIESNDDGWFASNRYTPQRAGWYQIVGIAACNPAGQTTGANGIMFRKNGTTPVGGQRAYTLTAGSASTTVYLNGTTDYIEFGVFSTATGTTSFVAPLGIQTFSGHWIKP